MNNPVRCCLLVYRMEIARKPLYIYSQRNKRLTLPCILEKVLLFISSEFNQEPSEIIGQNKDNVFIEIKLINFRGKES